jgi:hypothetical protein
MGDKSPKNQKKQLANVARKVAKAAASGSVVAEALAKPAR